MAVQTVVIDVFQTNKKLKEFDKNIDRLGKSFEKMRKQMERFNQDKRSTGLSLSQGDMFSKAVDKMTNTMTKLFSNGIKINNPTVNTKVTVDFAKMDIAGQMGSALKNADIAGTILRNLRLPKMGISNASAFKVDIPNKMQVEITNKELQVKLPKEPSQGKTNIRERYNNLKGRYVDKYYGETHVRTREKGSFEKGLSEKVDNITKNWNTIKGIPKDLMGLKNLPKIFSPVGNLFKGFFKGSVSNFSKISSVNGLAKAIPLAKGVGLGLGGIAMSGFTIFSVALKGLTGIIKGAAGVVKGVVGIFQGIASVLSSVWGQVQKWAVNPLVDAQNQMSQNKGYWKVLGGQEGAEETENKLYDMAIKGGYEADTLVSAFKKLKYNGVDKDKSLEVIWKTLNIAAAKSMDEEGFMQGIDAYMQVNSSQYASVEDFNSMGSYSDKETLAKHLLKKENSEEGDIKKVEELLSAGKITNEELKEAYEKAGSDYINLSKDFGAGFESIAEEVASTTYGGLTKKMKNIFQIDIVKKWGTGLSDGLADGFSEFASWLDENRAKFAAWGDQLKKIGKEIGEYITNFLQNTGDRMMIVFNSTEFQQADLSDKIVIFWDEVIKKPFSDWWNIKGRGFFESTFKNLGNTIGGILSGLINGFLGSNPTDAVGEGYNLGWKFAQGFMEGFDLSGLLGNIGKTLLKITWDYTLGLVVNPIINFFSTGTTVNKSETLEDSQYSHLLEGVATETVVIQETTGESIEEIKAKNQQNMAANTRNESIESAMQYEYSRAVINDFGSRNGVIDALYKQANDATWEYNSNAKLKEEAEANGDIEGARRAELKMLQAQNELNSATQQLHSIYPGIIQSEGMTLDIMKERLETQKKINEAKKNSELIRMENQLAVDEVRLPGQIRQAAEDKKNLENVTKKIDEFTLNSKNVVSDFQNWGKEYEEAKASGDTTKAEEEKTNLTNRFKAMDFSDEEIEKIFTDEEKNGYSGEALLEAINTKQGELSRMYDEADAKYQAAMAFLQEYSMMKNEVTKNQIEGIIGGPLEEMTEAQWKSLSDEDRKKVLGLIGDVDNLALKLKELGMESIYKDIFLRVQTIAGVAPEGGGENGQPTEGSSSTGKPPLIGPTQVVDASKLKIKTGNGVDVKEANGDILTSPHVALVAEAGPEAIIPLSKSRRARGLELWEKAGQMMGVYPHADGGMFGSFTVPRQMPHLYQQIEESREESESAGSMPARIDMGGVYLGGVNFTFNGTEANSREGIMKVIKEQMPDIADEIAGTIAINIQRIFANMQLQTG